MTTRKLRSRIARHSSTIAARRAAEDQLPAARRSRRASEDELAEDELAEDEFAEDELPVARRSKRGAKRGASRRASEDELAEDELAEDEFAEDELAEDELPVARRSKRGARRASDEDLAEDEFAEDELAEDEYAEDELAEDELPVARRSRRGARRGARRADDELAEDEFAEDELAEDELAEDELAEDELPVARRSRRAKRATRGAYSARGRIAAILDSNSARGRSTLAKHLALDTNLSPSAAFAILQASPRTASRAPQAARKGEDFRGRMRGLGNPKISNARGGGQGAGGEDDIVAQTLALGQRMGLSSIPKKGQ